MQDESIHYEKLEIKNNGSPIILYTQYDSESEIIKWSTHNQRILLTWLYAGKIIRIMIYVFVYY